VTPLPSPASSPALVAAVAAARALGQASENDFAALTETQGARHALRRLGAAGLLEWAVPEAWGGAATGGLVDAGTVSVRALCALREALAAHHGLLDVMLVMQGLGSYPLVLGASAGSAASDTASRTANSSACRARLSAVARGEQVAAFALTESGAGSNLAEVATSAQRSANGWRLDGRKTFISNAGLADFYTVLARTRGEPGSADGLSMYVVDAKSRGLSVAPFEVIAPHPIGEVVFDGVELPPEALLGQEHHGLSIALGTLARFRTTVAAAANGFARRAIDESRAHLSARRQFGKPLAANQALRFDLAEMDVRLRAAELLVAEAASAVDRGEPGTLEVARAKLYATESAGWICDRAVQHLGGLGVKRGSVVERLYREVRALRIYEGTSEIQKLIIAKELLA
jgi:acyl-CoA dehydrogenase